jgi:hypothetical protein
MRRDAEEPSSTLADPVDAPTETARQNRTRAVAPANHVRPGAGS